MVITNVAFPNQKFLRLEFLLAHCSIMASGDYAGPEAPEHGMVFTSDGQVLCGDLSGTSVGDPFTMALIGNLLGFIEKKKQEKEDKKKQEGEKESQNVKDHMQEESDEKDHQQDDEPEEEPVEKSTGKKSKNKGKKKGKKGTKNNRFLKL